MNIKDLIKMEKLLEKMIQSSSLMQELIQEMQINTKKLENEKAL